MCCTWYCIPTYANALPHTDALHSHTHTHTHTCLHAHTQTRRTLSKRLPCSHANACGTRTRPGLSPSVWQRHTPDLHTALVGLPNAFPSHSLPHAPSRTLTHPHLPSLFCPPPPPPSTPPSLSFYPKHFVDGMHAINCSARHRCWIRKSGGAQEATIVFIALDLATMGEQMVQHSWGLSFDDRRHLVLR